MKKIAFSLLAFLFIVIVTACYFGGAKPAVCGRVIAKNYFYLASTGEYKNFPMMSPNTNIWFKDSMAIIETIGGNVNIDDKGHSTTEMKIASYTFVDLKKKWYYQYHTFTDTARIEKKFTPFNKDSLMMYSVAWTFFNTEINRTSEQEKELTDTVIEDATYKRRQFLNPMHTKNEDWKDTAIGYYRCDKIGTLFTYGESYSRQMPCPMVKLQFLPNPPLHVSSATLSEIVYVSNTLTARELKVFDAWKKNEKKHPILR